MADTILFEPRASNAKLALDLSQMDSLVTAKVSELNSKLGSLSSKGGNSFLSSFSAANPEMAKFDRQLGQLSTSANTLDRSLSRMSSTLTGGLGIGVAVGGLALLERAFDRSISKAKEFQVAQLSIAASIASAYTLQGSQGAVTGGAAFARAQGDAGKLNQEIIERQAKNILTYQEQLGAFQSSLVAGAKKGFSPEQTLRVSEQLAIVAKTLGLHGEEIANASRIALGGATNVSRSTIGRALGITNEDIKSRSGDQLEKFLSDKTKGFQLAAPAFKDSIEGVLSTLQAKIDVFASHVGQKFFAMAQPAIQGFASVLESQDADKYAETLANVFGAALKAIETVATSPAIPLITNFLNFLGGYGDKILLASVFLKIAAAVNGTLAGLAALKSNLMGVAEAADTAAVSETRMAVATEAVQGASLGSKGGGGGTGAGGWIPWAQRPNSFRAQQYQNIQEEIGNIAPMPEGWLGTAGGAAFSGAFNNAAVKRRAAELETAERRRFTRQQANSQFEEWQGLMGQPGVSAEEHEAALGRVSEEKAAQQAAGQAQRALLRRNLVERASRGLVAGALTYGATDLARGYTDQYTGAPIGAGLQAGLTTGVGLAAAGVPAPWAAGIGAGVGVVASLNSAFKDLEDSVKKANEALKETEQKYPLAARIAERNATYSQAKATGLLTPYALENLRKSTLEENERDREAGTARSVADRAKSQAQEDIERLTKEKAAYSYGYGGANTLASLNQGFQLTAGNIGLSQASGELPLTAAQKQQAQDAFEKAEAAREAWRAGQKSRIDQGLDPQQMPASMLNYSSLEDTQQAFAGGSFRQQNLTHQMDELAKRQYTREGLTAGLNPDRIAGEQAKGRADLENTIIGSRDKFDTDDEYQKFGNQMRAKFEADFNMPLKRLEGQMEGLHLGVSGENVAQEANLAYQITSNKLGELVRTWKITGAEANELRVQAGAQRSATISADAYAKSNQAYGSDSAGRILGKEASEEMVGNFKKAGLLSVNNSYLAEAYDRRAQIESGRGQLNSTAFAQYQGLATAELLRTMQRSLQDTGRQLRDRQFGSQEENLNFQRLARRQPIREVQADENVAEARFNVQRLEANPDQLRRNAQQARLSLREAQLAPTLATGEGPFSGIASAIRFGVDAQRGFDPEKYAAAYRESISIKEQEAEIARKNLEAAVTNAQIDEKADHALADAKIKLAEALMAQSEGKQDFQNAQGRHNNAVTDAAEEISRLREDYSKRAGAINTLTGRPTGVTSAANDVSQFNPAGALGASGGSGTGLNITIPVTVGDHVNDTEIDAIVNAVITKLRDTLTRTSKKSA